MESLYRKYKDRGLRILAFPANDFGRQEPGTNARIRSFCREKLDVTFDLFAKISVKGDEMCDLYQFLTGKTAEHEFAGDIRWNFQKYLINPKGRIIARFDPRTSPEDKQMLAAIEAALPAGD